MRGWLSVHSKIVGRGNDASPEYMEPDPVDHDAGGQWIRSACDQVCNLQPPASECFHSLSCSGDELQEAAWYDLTGMVRVSCREHWKVVASFEVGHAIERLGGSNLRFRQTIVVDELLQTCRLATGIGEQPVLQQPTNPARIIVIGMA